LPVTTGLTGSQIIAPQDASVIKQKIYENIVIICPVGRVEYNGTKERKNDRTIWDKRKEGELI
jgi:hypothetical protein